MEERSKSDKQNQPQDKQPRYTFSWLYVLIVLMVLFYFFFRDYSAVKEITWNEFDKNMLSRHAVEKIEVVNNEVAYVYIREEFANDSLFKDAMKPIAGDTPNSGPHFQFNIGSVESFEKKMDAAQANFAEHQKVNISYEKKRSWFIDIFPWLIPLFLFIIMWQFLSRIGSGSARGASSVFNFGRSTAMLVDKENKSTTTFEDVAGLDEAKQEVKEIVDFLKEPLTYTRLGAKIPKGIIIVGPPGTGKTLLAKAVAGEARVPFFSLSGSEFVEMFVGVGASRVRDLFKRAKEKAPCIVFIDEIDAVGRTRGKNTISSGANDERESTLNQLLTEMDGFATNSGVIVLAATNRADSLDPALLRPGRFDRHIYLELPNFTERKAIFNVHMKSLMLSEEVGVDFLASQTPGFSGADIANLCNEAALIAARRKKDNVGKQDFIDAMDRIVAGLEKKSKVISPEEKQIIAYHEAGHAVVSWLLPTVDPLMKVSIIPRGRSLGAAWYLPEERQLKTVTRFTEGLCAVLGGRAAEEIIFGEVSSGALDDLEKVTKEAYTMVAYYGFNKTIGNISFYDSSGKQDVLHKPYSEETGKLIDEEVRKLVENAYQQTKSLLKEHTEELKKIATLLLSKEIIFKEDIEKVLGKRTEEKKNYRDGVSNPLVALKTKSRV